MVTTDLSLPETHAHSTKAIDDRIAALEGRVTKLETGSVPVPPPPSGRRFALPTTVRTVQFPPSIATDGSEVTAKIKAFLAGVPDGTTILGAGPTAKYGITGSMLPSMAGHNHWILDWLGALVTNSAVAPVAGGPVNSDEYAMSGFYGHWTEKPFPTHITIRNLVYKASNPKPGTLSLHEYGALVHLMGAQYVELDNIAASGTWGDLATFNEDAQYGWVHNSKTTDVGRNNVSIVCASHIYVEDCDFGQAGYCVYDLEPEPSSIANIDDVVIRRNLDKGYWSLSKAKSWLAVDGVDSGKKVTNLSVDSNTSTGPLTMSVGGVTGKARPGHVSITTNAGAAGGNVTVRHTDFLTAKGNTGAGKLIVPGLTDCPNPFLT